MAEDVFESRQLVATCGYILVRASLAPRAGLDFNTLLKGQGWLDEQPVLIVSPAGDGACRASVWTYTPIGSIVG